MDILAALEATATPTLGRRCVIGRFIDDIPEDAPGRERLLAILTTTLDRRNPSPDWIPGDAIRALLARLDLITSVETINRHRNHGCECTF